MSRFHYPRSLTAEEKARGEIEYHDPLPEGANTALCKDLFGQLEQYEGKYVNREKIYCTSLVSPLPHLCPFS
jgi:hypothetical protein